METLCWINHRVVPADQAAIPVMDHGLLYGDGIFEGLRFYHGRVFKLEQHLRRLERSARAIALQLPYPLDEIASILNQVVTQYPAPSGYLRLVVTRGAGNLGINPRHCRQPSLFVIAGSLQVVSAAARGGIDLHLASTRRVPAECLDPRVKSLNYLNNILARIEAHQVGADEAVMLNTRGFVTEGTVDNIFIVDGGVLATPPLSAGILDGITRGCILEIAARAGIACVERALTAYDLLNADECFLSGTGAELIAVQSIDRQPLRDPERPLFHRIERLFQAHIEECCAGLVC
ncbi:MAG: aminotransferase class IV [Gammaproteobacteria bacterium]|nr:aminotransferase class IV [Gammaproteobacteria bacterium]